ncbi:GDSL-type esterase/lipase family protein [Nodosilinea sp. P-1105]|uniref:GDSL-type esterase/lipase family protein n=1 Tax=Nodosilinea sp. P-1105 TaxID=2546229 RepID=UPI00146F40F9|nr:lysophospholipase [Nodosilinea sp. P-1105]
MAPPLQHHPQLRKAIRYFQGVPPWALLSLVLNGLLFVTVLVTLRQLSLSSQTVLSQSNAFASDLDGSTTTVAPELGQRHTLDYQQWVALLQAEAEAAEAINAPRQTVLLGDSLTLWFPPEMLPGRKTWLNQAISGENSSGLRNRIHLLDNNTLEAAFIMVGINDLIWGGSDADLVYNIRRIVGDLQQAHPELRIVVQSVLPHGGARASWEGRDRLADIPPGQIQAINQQLRLLAVEMGVEFLDLYPLFADGDGYLRPDLSTDGLHLNQEGYRVWRTALALINETDFQP